MLHCIHRATKNSYRVSCSLNIKKIRISNRRRKELSSSEKIIDCFTYSYEK